MAVEKPFTTIKDLRSLAMSIGTSSSSSVLRAVSATKETWVRPALRKDFMTVCDLPRPPLPVTTTDGMMRVATISTKSARISKRSLIPNVNVGSVLAVTALAISVIESPGTSTTSVTPSRLAFSEIWFTILSTIYSFEEDLRKTCPPNEASHLEVLSLRTKVAIFDMMC